MIVKQAGSFILPFAALALASCNSDSAPAGQVAATVDGQEITISEVNAELGGVNVSDPEQQQAVANAALDAIIARTIVGAEAEERGLDKTPEGAMALKRARQLALVELLQRELRGTVPVVSDQEARRFVAENRAIFADRTIDVVDQLAVPQIPAELIQQMEAIDTLPEIRQFLDSNGIEYQANLGTIDSLTLNSDLARQIGQMTIGEVYVIPAGNGARINGIRARETYPITGDAAVAVAKEMLARQRTAGQISSALDQIIVQGKQTVRYADGFAAPQAAAPAPGAAPPPAANGAANGADGQ